MHELGVTSVVIQTNRPRDRIWRAGPTSSGDCELIALVLGSQSRHRAIATELVHSAGGIATLSRSTPREISQITGIGPAGAARVAAAFELGRRVVEHEQARDLLGRAEDVYRICAHRIAGLVQEVFLVIGVDIRNRVLDVVEVARGSVAGVEVHPREVFRPLIRMAAAGGVLVHNHPSGDPSPSPEDLLLTRRLREVGTLLGIPIIDHVVIGDAGFRSIAESLADEE